MLLDALHGGLAFDGRRLRFAARLQGDRCYLGWYSEGRGELEGPFMDTVWVCHF